MQLIERMESNVRSYCRSFPAVFDRAVGCKLYDRHGAEYLDFFAGAGALNYGHNDPEIKARLLEYIAADGITHSLDMATDAKCRFFQTMDEVILQPRELDYKVMFPGPTGTNAVEAALKLARKVTGRTNVVAFTNGFHGMTLGSLALTGTSAKRAGAGVALTDVTHMPFCNYFGPDTYTIEMLEGYLSDASAGALRGVPRQGQRPQRHAVKAIGKRHHIGAPRHLTRQFQGCFDCIGAGWARKLELIGIAARLENHGFKGVEKLFFSARGHVESVDQAIAADIVNHLLLQQRVVVAVIEGAGTAEKIDVFLAVFVVQPGPFSLGKNGWEGTGIAHMHQGNA